MIDFPAVKNKYTFYLDRKSKRVTIDINANSQIFSKHLSAPMLNETTTIRSLALSFSQNSITLYVDCKSAVKEEMEFNLSKLYLNMDEPEVKLMRERKYPLFLDKKTDAALSRANCQKPWKPKGNKKTLKDIDSVGYYSGTWRNFNINLSLDSTKLKGINRNIPNSIYLHFFICNRSRIS